MNKRLHESKYFRLQQETNRQNGRKLYRIVWYNSWYNVDIEQEQVRDIVDPLRNKSGHHGYDWKFKNRQEAEKYYTMLLLRWS